MKGKCKKDGGKVEAEAEDKKDGFKLGGKVKGKGLKVGGKKGKMRADKKARGGKAEKAGTPLSKADSTAEKKPKMDKEDD